MTITSVTPNPASNGVEVTVVLATSPGAATVIRITDPGGGIANQRRYGADDQGAVIHLYVISGAPGTWMVQAAAAASVADLLILQQNLIPGPYYDATTFTVQ